MDNTNPNDGGITLDPKDVAQGASKRPKGRKSKKQSDMWAIASDGKLQVIAAPKGVADLIEPIDEPAMLEVSMKVGRKGDIEAPEFAHIRVGDSVTSFATKIDIQSWTSGRALFNGSALSTSADEVMIQMPITEELVDILSHVTASQAFGSVGEKSFQPAKAQGYISARFYTPKADPDTVALWASPMLNFSRVHPKRGDGPGKGYERNQIPGRTFIHVLKGRDELVAKKAVETLYLDKEVRDASIRVAITEELFEAMSDLKGHLYSVGSYGQGGGSEVDVDFV